MPTWNKELQSLSLDEIYKVSERFLMGWHDPKYDGHNFRIKGLNARRQKFGLEPLTKEWSMAYRLDYIRGHYTADEIKTAISDYLQNNRIADTRWQGIEILNCRFGRDYVKAFRALIGSSEYRYLSEKKRIDKLSETQVERYGGIGVAGHDTYVKMEQTKLRNIEVMLAEYKTSGVIKNESIFTSIAEKTVFYTLVSRFGKKDVFFQYGIHPSDKRYPYSCDFYIKSLDLFIELNVHFSHHNHWFDENNSDDLLVVKNWASQNKRRYDKAINIWTKSDVAKRNKAKHSQIKYLVFWDGKYLHGGNINGKRSYHPRLRDFYSWFFDYDCDYEKFIADHPENTY